MLKSERIRDRLSLSVGNPLAPDAEMEPVKRFVYVLKNNHNPPQYYTGLAADVSSRLARHNQGRSPHTSTRGPWQVDVVVEFPDEGRAAAFERYLKSGSGCAFATRHLR